MHINTKAIVLNAIRYQEKSLIVKCFTRDYGLKSYFIHSAFSRSSGRKASYFQPLTVADISASHKNKGTLENIRDVGLALPFQTIASDVVKSTIAIFVAELLHHSIREEESNVALFDFLETAIHWLDTHEETANFHLILTLHVTRFLGFYPDASTSAGPFFDMMEGRFTDECTVNCLSGDETALFRKLLGLKFSGSQKLFTSTERQSLLKILLDYYQLHLEGFRRPKSVEVLREIFA